MERTYEVFPERRRRQRAAQKHWVESDSIGVEMMRAMGFTGSVAPTDGIDVAFETERKGIGAVATAAAKRESLQDVLKRIRAASPAGSPGAPERDAADGDAPAAKPAKDRAEKKPRRDDSQSYHSRRKRMKPTTLSADQLVGVL